MSVQRIVPVGVKNTKGCHGGRLACWLERLYCFATGATYSLLLKILRLTGKAPEYKMITKGAGHG